MLLMLAAGCSSEQLPRLGMPKPITQQGERVLSLWQGGWIAAFFVGAIVWGLILWCVVAYRKRGDGVAPQLTYNLPIEILYTFVPFIFVGVFFYFTARDETELDKLSAHPDVTVEVVGFQWSWQFNYLDGPESGAKTIAQVTGSTGERPTLTLPTDRTIRFKLVSPDVIHSFWVPSFLFKRDIIPGRTNEFEVTITKQGTYIGRCAELCGLDHDRMLFDVHVVSPTDYDSFLKNQEAAYSSAGSSS
jgi:cytochrome c oxidase subunit 2